MPASSGIDYLRLVEARRRSELARRIDYRNLAACDDNTGPDPTIKE
jgi:hypothetical protein